jgi:regulator of replication initiation timing
MSSESTLESLCKSQQKRIFTLSSQIEHVQAKLKMLEDQIQSHQADRTIIKQLCLLVDGNLGSLESSIFKGVSIDWDELEPKNYKLVLEKISKDIFETDFENITDRAAATVFIQSSTSPRNKKKFASPEMTFEELVVDEISRIHRDHLKGLKDPMQEEIRIAQETANSVQTDNENLKKRIIELEIALGQKSNDLDLAKLAIDRFQNRSKIAESKQSELESEVKSLLAQIQSKTASEAAMHTELRHLRAELANAVSLTSIAEQQATRDHEISMLKQEIETLKSKGFSAQKVFYLKSVFIKFLEFDRNSLAEKKLAILPVIADLLEFDENDRNQAFQ